MTNGPRSIPLGSCLTLLGTEAPTLGAQRVVQRFRTFHTLNFAFSLEPSQAKAALTYGFFRRCEIGGAC